MRHKSEYKLETKSEKESESKPDNESGSRSESKSVCKYGHISKDIRKDLSQGFLGLDIITSR